MNMQQLRVLHRKQISMGPRIDQADDHISVGRVQGQYHCLPVLTDAARKSRKRATNLIGDYKGVAAV